jgi:hypothetical protein
MFALLSRFEIAVTIGVLGAIALVGLQRGAPASHLGLELVGAGLYGIAAVLGTRRWPALLAFGWTAHVAWDLFFHYASGPAFAPVWYPWFCVGVSATERTVHSAAADAER